MNPTMPTTLMLHLLATSGAVLLTGFVLHCLFRHRAAARRELVWRTVFVVVALLPWAWFLRPWGLIRPDSDRMTAAAGMTAAVDSGQAISAGAAVPAPVMTRPSASIGLAEILFSIWIAGSALLLARLFMSAGLRRRWLVSAREYRGTPVEAVWQRISGTVRARLLLSPDCPVPLTWGRTVILPQDALTWSDGHVEASLRHEAAHLMRRDSFFRRIGEIAVALFWPQPLVWLARRLWHRMQEQACDDVVLAGGSDPAVYAELLCRVARAWTKPSAAEVAMAQPSSLERRILAVMNPACDRRPCSKSAMRAALLIGFSSFAAAAFAQERPASPSAPPAPATPPAVQIKASKIIVPRIVFNEARLADAIKLLSLKAKELDPDKKGITITGPAKPPARTVTLDLRNASLWHILTLVAEVSGTTVDAGPNGIVFKDGPALRNAFPASAIETKAQRIKLGRVVFEKATVDEMVQFVRKKCIEADTAEPDAGKKGLNIITKDAGAGTYSLSLQNASAWEVLNRIAEIAGMHRAGIRRTNDGTESIILDRSVLYGEALGISDAVAGSPQFRALERMKIAGVNANGTLKDAAAALANDIAAASGGRLKVKISVAPAIEDDSYQFEAPASHALLRLTSLTNLGKFELALDGDGFQVRPRSPR
jgi:beta-lactamase regulating signal transducer with metallopeptidase domain